MDTKKSILENQKQLETHHTEVTWIQEEKDNNTVKLVYNDTLGATKMCCYNQVVVVTRIFSTETIESVSAMCVAVKRLLL